LALLFPHPPLLTPVSANQSTDTRNESEIPVHNLFELLQLSEIPPESVNVAQPPIGSAGLNASFASLGYALESRAIDAASVDSQELLLKDDSISNLLEFALNLQVYESLSAEVFSYWEEVAAGNMLMTHAAWLTMVAWRATRRVVKHTWNSRSNETATSDIVFSYFQRKHAANLADSFVVANELDDSSRDNLDDSLKPFESGSAAMVITDSLNYFTKRLQSGALREDVH